MQSASQSSAQSPEAKPAKPWQFRPGQSGLPQGRYALMKERARLEEAERQAEAEALLVDLGRGASAMERALAAEAAALMVEARRLRRLGKSSIECSRLLSRVLGQLGVRDRRAPSEPQVDVATYLAEAAARHEAAEAAQADEDEAGS